MDYIDLFAYPTPKKSVIEHVMLINGLFIHVVYDVSKKDAKPLKIQIVNQFINE